MKRGDLITIAQSGDYGKPRPAVVVQTDGASLTDSVLVCMLTSMLIEESSFRVRVKADSHTGLSKDSDVMADKIATVLRTKCGPVFGQVPHREMQRLGDALTLILGLDAP